MSLSHAVLTSLIEKSSSGYELARRFDKSIGYFWHATHQQIYRELARMEAAGWIESSSAPDAGKTRKREYRVLPAGRAELARWAGEPSPPMDLRDEFMVKLRADAALGEVDLRDELRRRIGLHHEKLAHYRAIEQRDFPAGATLSRLAQIHHMILKKGILYEEASIAWDTEMLAVLASY
ncbi:MAG TPA: PadR family transcriptional regulator [Rhodoferax sp.]|jgi:DNA-binding PadR family transcriptional regulator|nr:PadR family transcriptional regulator [Rhodoferax sp.]HQC84257.1 PadR family transcriptional regulator [Rhodoferax sp.]HQY76027.1 PadR family transcriptional regulator [Rhodoferax sp.]